MNLTSTVLGVIVFGIFDFIWSGVKLSISYYIAVEDSTRRDFAVEFGFYFIDGALSAVFAGLLVHGARKRRQDLLVVFMFWQVIVTITQQAH
jgi:hypothetical protein